MFKNHKILVSCFMLASLYASGAKAVTCDPTCFVNPGPVGGLANGFIFSTSSLPVLDIVWTDNKTLEWEEGQRLFFIFGPPSQTFGGFLLDASGDIIPGTEIIGDTTAPFDFGFGYLDLPETTVFSGIRLLSNWDGTAGYSWEWHPDDRPLIGAGVIPVPAAVWLFGSGLLGLIGVARRKKG